MLARVRRVRRRRLTLNHPSLRSAERSPPRLRRSTYFFWLSCVVLISDGQFPLVTTREAEWRCPRCGRTFANANQWHSCGTFRVEDHLASADAKVAALYQRFERMVRRCGSVTLTPTKDRIRFRGLVQLASAQLQRDALRVGLVLGRKLKSARIEQILTFTPGGHVHGIKIRRPEELDAELQRWLREAYAVARTR